MTQKIIHLITAARPNMMKVAPLWHALQQEPWAKVVFVHTGQHYDPKMSDVFLKQLGMPEPDYNFGIGGGTHGEQTGRVIMAYEKLCLEARPDVVIVVGDVNATAACTIAAKKLNIMVAHMEAGLRSRDRTMPEETNRLITDAICDIHWTPSDDATDNLRAEGVYGPRVRMVGNVMIDAYERMKAAIAADNTRERMGLTPRQYGVATLHRPANVDDPDQLGQLLTLIQRVARKTMLVFPVHMRTRQRIEAMGLLPELLAQKNLKLVEPLGYVEFMNLVSQSCFALTDSGGLQEETSYLGIPCLTLRPSTERPVTITHGTNQLVTLDNAEAAIDTALALALPLKKTIPSWDGKTAGRTVAHLKEILLKA